MMIEQKQMAVNTSTYSFFREFTISEDVFGTEIDFEKSMFAKKKLELLKNPEFVGKHVAVIKGEVVDKDDDKDELLTRVYDKYGYVPILIEKISDEVIEYTTSPNFEL